MEVKSLTSKRLLFIAHDASRTGAPILLLDLVKWIKQHHPEIQIEILVGVIGPLISQFSLYGNTYLWHKEILNTSNYFTSFLSLQISRIRKLFIWLFLKWRQYDLIFVNSIAGCKFYNLIARASSPTILYAMELEHVIKTYCGEDHLLRMIPRLNKILTASKVVKKNLIESYGIDPSLISVVYHWLPSIHLPVKENSKLNLPEEAFVVGGSGTVTWVKGVDIFLEAAIKVLDRVADKTQKPIYFVWLGRFFDSEFSKNVFKKLKDSGYSDHIRFVGSVSNPLSYYQRFDLFFLSSREDPFPLVVIENAIAGKPVLCFDQGNGSIEILDSSNAFIIPFLDVEKAVETILQATQEPKKTKLMGINAKSRFLNFTIENTGPKIFGIIQAFLK